MLRSIVVIQVGDPEGDAATEHYSWRNKIVVRMYWISVIDQGFGKHESVRGVVAITRGEVIRCIICAMHPVVRRVAVGALQDGPTLGAVFEVVNKFVLVDITADGDGTAFCWIWGSLNQILVLNEARY